MRAASAVLTSGRTRPTPPVMRGAAGGARRRCSRRAHAVRATCRSARSAAPSGRGCRGRHRTHAPGSRDRAAPRRDLGLTIRGENNCAGSPTATQPIGTTVPSGSTARRSTIALTRTSQRGPISAPLNSRDPEARNVSSPTVAPAMLDSVPIRVCDPMCTAFAAVARMSAFSITMTCSPRVIAPPSAVITAPCSTWQPARSRRRRRSRRWGAMTAVS